MPKDSNIRVEKGISRFYIPTPWWRQSLYVISKPITSLVGNVSLRFGMDYLGTDEHYEQIKSLIKPGMVIVSHDRMETSNWFIDGYWDHAAMILDDDGTIIEAVDPCVRLCNLRNFIKRHDYVLLLDPCFADTNRMQNASVIARELIGRPYDNTFTFSLKDNHAIYCSEVVWWSYEMTYKYVGEYSPFVPRKILGQYTLLPQDFVDSATLWQPIWTNQAKFQSEIPA